MLGINIWADLACASASPIKINDDDCLLVKLTPKWGSSGNLDGASVAYTGPNSYSTLSLIRAYLDVTLINQID